MPPPNTFITVGLQPAVNLGARANLITRMSPSPLAPTTVLRGNTSTPQQYIAVGLNPALALTITTINQPKGIAAALAPAAALTATDLWRRAAYATLQPTTNVAVRGPPSVFQTMKFGVGSTLRPEALFSSYIGVRHTVTQFGAFRIGTTISVPNVLVGIPRPIAAHMGIGSNFRSTDLLLAKYFGAQLTVEAVAAADIDWVKMQWDRYGSQLLYAAASGLEKAMIDVDAPRQVGIYAEAIIDTWDPYRCPFRLLPYLAWAMGVNFWNDNWSEQTKRDWIAIQWTFKSLRGSNAGIEMVVDFAGRDVSPFGYKVRRIITQPQGQYPSPGTTHEQQEAWLATLPQVRVFLYQEPGQAYPAEFYINYSHLSP